jgi:hypothetical protein
VTGSQVRGSAEVIDTAEPGTVASTPVARIACPARPRDGAALVSERQLRR